VAELQGIDLKTGFPRLLQVIVQDLALCVPDDAMQQHKFIPTKVKPIQSVSTQCHPNNGEKQEELPYSFEIQPFDDGLLAYWAHYGIYEETLRRFRVRSLRSYASQKREGKPFEVKATPTEPIFAYIGNGYIKVYRPNSSKMRFLYGGRLPSPYCFGMEQTPSKGDMLIITGGEKDVLSLSAHHFHAICFNSETAQIPENIIESLQLCFRHIILLYDTDESGVRESDKQASLLEPYKVQQLQLPLKGTKTERIYPTTLH